MLRSFASLCATWLFAAVAVGACGRASGRPDAGAAGNSASGAGGATGAAGTGGIASGGGAGAGAGSDGTGSGGIASDGGTGGVAGTGGTPNGDSGGQIDAGDGQRLDGGSDGNSDAGGVIVDAADAPREAGTQTPECLAKNGTEYRVILIGAGFEAYEGRNLIAVTTDSRIDPCRASGTTRIRDGAFQIELVNLAAALYPNIDAFIDLDDDGGCSNGVDAKWHITGVLTGARIWMSNLTPTNLSVPGNCAESASF